MPEPDPYAGWPPSDGLRMLAFEAELARVPRSLITAIWEAVDLVCVEGHSGRGLDLLRGRRGVRLPVFKRRKLMEG